MASVNTTADLTLDTLRQALQAEWSFSELPVACVAQLPIQRIVTDSRQVRRGDVFWALPGKNGSGSQFVDEAYASGAWGVISDRADVSPPHGCWSATVA